MLRSVYSSVLSLLLVVTLFWGGCVSCPQFFMFPKADKSCCNKAGQCERPTKNAVAKECKRMPLESQAFASMDVSLAALPASMEPVAIAALVSTRHRDLPDPHYSPPDLTVLNSAFVI